MSLADSYSLNGDTQTDPSTAEGAQNFELDYRDKEQSVRAVAGAGPSTPHFLTIKHQDSVRGGIKRRRSLVRFDKTIADAVNGPQVLSTYLVIDSPIGTTVTSTHVLAALGRLKALLGFSGIGVDLAEGAK